MKLKELLEQIEKLSKLTTGKMMVNIKCDCKLGTDVDLVSKSSVPKIDIDIWYSEKKDD